MTSEPSNHEVHSLFFETSPYGNIDAIVEHDGRAVHFYLNGKDFGTRACWVRNLTPGPYVLNVDEMKQGIPPMLPRTHCKYSDGRPLFAAEDLNVIWFEEGNGAALFEKEEILAVIPPWSGSDGFHGYAEECAAENQLCWPLPGNQNLAERIKRAATFWRKCREPDRHPFAIRQPEILEALNNHFGLEGNYFAIDGGQFPPRGLADYTKNETTTFATVGMSICPQPNVELMVEQPSGYRRVELAIQTDEPNLISQLKEKLSTLAGYPWRSQQWYGHGHTLMLLGDDHPTHAYALLVHDVAIARSQNEPELSLGAFRGDPTNLLWLIPISADEKKEYESNQDKNKLADWISQRNVVR